MIEQHDINPNGESASLILENGDKIAYQIWRDGDRRSLTATVKRGRIALDFGPACFTPELDDPKSVQNAEIKAFASGTLTHWVSNFEADLKKLLG